MENAFRRSGVRLRSASSGHTELQLVISEVKEMKAASRKFMNSQKTATEDLLKWALLQENRAIQDTVSQVQELNMIWSDVQREFADNLKEYRNQFELILEDEKHLDSVKQKLAAAESKEVKIRKELEKAARKSSSCEISEIESRLKQATDTKDLIQAEVLECHKENEAVKLIRMKQNMLKSSEAYLEMAHKCIYIFEAQRDVAHALPDVHDTDIHNIKYTGAVAVRKAVHNAKERVEHYRRNSIPQCGMPSAPPPYNPFYDADNCRRSCSSEFAPSLVQTDVGWNVPCSNGSDRRPPTYSISAPSVRNQDSPYDQAH